MKKLIALALIAAATYAENQPAFQAGEKFEAPDDLADRMIADQVAKIDEPAAAPAKAVKTTRVRLLVDCPHGKVNAVVSLPADVAKGAIAEGMADDSKPGIEYALSLVKPAASDDE